MSDKSSTPLMAMVHACLISLTTGHTAAAVAQADVPQAATNATAAINRAVMQQLDFADQEDFELATRGFVAPPEGLLVGDPRLPARNLGAWDIFRGPAPATVNPSLWRQAGLISRAGLFKVTDHVYQVRGVDASNITFVLGQTGFIVIDAGMVEEAAKAALTLARKHLGNRPVTALIYTHAHSDHFGGAAGIVGKSPLRVPIISPKGFVEAAIDENILLGPAMLRRAAYLYGAELEISAKGAVGTGIAPSYQDGFGRGTISFIPPNDAVNRTGETRLIDGVSFVFQLTPDTESPAEMNIFMPELHVLCMAENLNVGLHNIGTLRGAPVRNAKAWAAYLDESISLFGRDAEAVILAHGWPRWGTDKIVEFMAQQRDTYKFIHDQTVRLINDGFTPNEVAEKVVLPASLGRKWFNRPYYGTVSQNVRAVYQRYLGWYDGNPVNLDPLPPEEEAKRLVSLMGGAEKISRAAKDASTLGDYRWASYLLGKLVFAEPNDRRYRLLLADVLEQLGYQAESGGWRNEYLVAALELRKADSKTSLGGAGGGDIPALPVEQMLEILSVRLDPSRYFEYRMVVSLPSKERLTEVWTENYVLHSRQVDSPSPGWPIMSGSLDTIAELINGVEPQKLVDSNKLQFSGSAKNLKRFLSQFGKPTKDFEIVTP